MVGFCSLEKQMLSDDDIHYHWRWVGVVVGVSMVGFCTNSVVLVLEYELGTTQVDPFPNTGEIDVEPVGFVCSPIGGVVVLGGVPVGEVGCFCVVLRVRTRGFGCDLSESRLYCGSESVEN